MYKKNSLQLTFSFLQILSENHERLEKLILESTSHFSVEFCWRLSIRLFQQKQKLPLDEISYFPGYQLFLNKSSGKFIPRGFRKVHFKISKQIKPRSRRFFIRNQFSFSDYFQMDVRLPVKDSTSPFRDDRHTSPFPSSISPDPIRLSTRSPAKPEAIVHAMKVGIYAMEVGIYALNVVDDTMKVGNHCMKVGVHAMRVGDHL